MLLINKYIILIGSAEKLTNVVKYYTTDVAFKTEIMHYDLIV